MKAHDEVLASLAAAPDDETRRTILSWTDEDQQLAAKVDGGLVRAHTEGQPWARAALSSVVSCTPEENGHGPNGSCPGQTDETDKPGAIK